MYANNLDYFCRMTYVQWCSITDLSIYLGRKCLKFNYNEKTWPGVKLASTLFWQNYEEFRGANPGGGAAVRAEGADHLAMAVDWWTEGLVLPIICLVGIGGKLLLLVWGGGSFSSKIFYVSFVKFWDNTIFLIYMWVVLFIKVKSSRIIQFMRENNLKQIFWMRWWWFFLWGGECVQKTFIFVQSFFFCFNWFERRKMNKMGCFNDLAWKVCGWGGVADTNYLFPARWGWINSSLGLDQ